MRFVPLTELAQDASKSGYALPGFCVWSSEAMETVLCVAEQLRSPVVLMNGPGEFPLLKPPAMAATAYGLKKRYSIPAALHLDHANSMELVRECIAAGYTSVMLDLSTMPFEEHVKGMKEVVALAHSRGISVEGEIGTVGSGDAAITEGTGESVFTDAGQAQRYVTETGVDLLAISVGNVHGAYKGTPNLDFALLKRISDIVSTPLVLHGGSGIPETQVKKAIALGIAKINVGTELMTTIRESLSSQWSSSKNLWFPLALSLAMKNMGKVVEKWINYVGSAGKA